MRQLYQPMCRVLATLFAIFCTAGLYAQSAYTIKGKVTETGGNAIPGVSVAVSGTTQGTITDADGNYTLNAKLPAGDYKIVFSYIGYASLTQTVGLGSQTEITANIQLKEDIASLDEVVVIGSSINAPRRQLGNAINVVSAKSLQNTGTENPLGALQGKVPGAQITQNSGDPAGGFTVRLRGVKSLRGSSVPLYVIDGVIVSNSTANVSQLAVSAGEATSSLGTNRLADINPQDIENINVLNGAAAAAIYGSRAANGVVVINTKRGKSGVPKITFTTAVGISELRKRVFISKYGEQFGSATLRLHTIGAVSATPTAPITSQGFVRDGAPPFFLATNKVPVTRYDYQDNIFQQGSTLDNNLSVAGGKDNTQYYASVSYAKNTGIIPGTSFQRYGLRLRLDQRLTDWAKISAGVTYTNSLANEKPNGNTFASPINSINITNNIYDITQRDANGNLKAVEPSRVNPLTVLEEFAITQRVNRTINDVQLNLNPFKGFQLDWIVGLDAYSQTGKTYIPPYPYASEAGLPAGLFPTGFTGSAINSVYLFNTDLNAKYDWTISPSFTLNAVAGYNYQYSREDFSQATGENIAPGITNISGATGNTVRAFDGLDQFSINGVFGQATLGYKDRRFITAALRRDGSTKFSPSETGQLYPKISGSWVVSDEIFWQNLSIQNIVSDMKLRASYGEAGNLNGIRSYDRFRNYNPVPFLGRNTILPSAQLNNPRVRPERSTEVEFGVDVSFFNDRIGLSLTRYNQQIKELVVNRLLAPAASGGINIVNNVAQMENKGWELALNATPVKTNDWNWEIGVVYSRNRNKVTNTGLAGNLNIAISSALGAPAFIVKDQAASVFFGTHYARKPDGSLLLTAQDLPQSEKTTKDGNGQPTGAVVRKVIGDPNPDYTASFNSTLTYKRFTFRFLLDAVQGFEVFNADKRTRNNVGIGDLAEKELKGEIPRGYVFALVPIEEYRIDDGSFVKLREIALTYNLPPLVKGLNNLSVSLIGRNLYSWDNYFGYDPETNAGANSDILRGTDFGNVPIPRSYQFSVTAGF